VEEAVERRRLQLERTAMGAAHRRSSGRRRRGRRWTGAACPRWGLQVDEEEDDDSPLRSGWCSPAWLAEEDPRAAALAAVGASTPLTSTAPGGERRNGAGGRASARWGMERRDARAGRCARRWRARRLLAFKTEGTGLVGVSAQVGDGARCRRSEGRRARLAWRLLAVGVARPNGFGRAVWGRTLARWGQDNVSACTGGRRRPGVRAATCGRDAGAGARLLR
jgi:hypothetical protein